MRLLAFTDTHADPDMMNRIARLVKQERPDLLVCAGDFTLFGTGARKFLQALNAFSRPVVLIHGNHEDADEIAHLAEPLENVHFIHNKLITVNGQKFLGWGGHGFREREPDLEELDATLGHEIDGSTIIVSHAPPYGTALDQPDPGWNVGCQTLTDVIRKRKPMLVFCGHIHECFHARDTVAGALIINPGPDGEIIEVGE